MVALTCAITSLVQIQNRLNRGNRGIQSLGDFSIGRFKAARTSSLAVERGRKTRAVEAQCLNLGSESFFAPISLLPPLDRSIESVERKRETLH
jgi:hypothetical protein